MKYAKHYSTSKKINLLGCIASIFYPEHKLEGLKVSLCNLFGEVQCNAIVLKVKEKLKALFDEY